MCGGELHGVFNNLLEAFIIFYLKYSSYQLSNYSL